MRVLCPVDMLSPAVRWLVVRLVWHRGGQSAQAFAVCACSEELHVVALDIFKRLCVAGVADHSTYILEVYDAYRCCRRLHFP